MSIAMDGAGPKLTAVERQRPWVARLGGNVVTYAILIFFFFVFLMPFVWIWFSAFKTKQEIAKDPFSPPTSLAPDNLVQAWTVGRFSQYILNSVIYSFAIVLGVALLSCLAGYALAQLPLPGRNGIFVLFLMGLMIPFQSVMIPRYYLLRDVNILETYWAFILPGIAVRLPFGIFLMRGFFRGLPGELADASRTDGANEWQVFRQVMLPLSWPGLATLIVFQFMWTWNQFAMPLIFVQREELRPVSLGTMFFFGRFTADRGLIAAGVTIAMIPIVALYLVLQRRFIEGITAGALKS
ncbi:MAG: carbohydrate ABC transporter permease [Thermomicrobiales bacterium]|nr:carbohydrate ABC transporter permease [Thermomicrobiales bacterium]